MNLAGLKISRQPLLDAEENSSESLRAGRCGGGGVSAVRSMRSSLRLRSARIHSYPLRVRSRPGLPRRRPLHPLEPRRGDTTQSLHSGSAKLLSRLSSFSVVVCLNSFAVASPLSYALSYSVEQPAKRWGGSSSWLRLRLHLHPIFGFRSSLVASARPGSLEERLLTVPTTAQAVDTFPDTSSPRQLPPRLLRTLSKKN